MRRLERDVSWNVQDLVTVLSGASGVALHFPGVVCVQTASPFLSFNSAYVESPLGLSESSLEQVRAFYEGAPEWAVNVPGPMARLFPDYQERVKVWRVDTQWEMVMKRAEARFRRRPSPLEIERIESVRRLSVWASTSAQGFEMPSRSFDCFVNEETLRMPGMAYFLGKLNGKPVSTSASYVSDGIAGVYFIASIKAARGHGYGEALVAACAREGFSAGCEIASLQCGPWGYPWYSAMGFHPLFYYERWVSRGKV